LPAATGQRAADWPRLDSRNQARRFRILAELDGGSVRLITRKGLRDPQQSLAHFKEWKSQGRGDWASLGPNQACGCLPVAGLLVEAERRGLKVQRLSLCNSGDTARSRDRVVGYGAWMFA